MKEYRCNAGFHAIHVTVSNLIMAALCVAGVYLAAVYPSLRVLFILIAVTALYSAWNAFVALANPSVVRLGPEGVAFSAYGREHRYLRSEITSFRVREVGGRAKFFLRVNRPGLLRGRYWVDLFYFDDADELASALLALEDELHPDSLKAVARSGRPLRAKGRK